MDTYYIVFNVIPTKEGKQLSNIDGALAHVFIVDTSSENALELAKDYLSVYNWEIVSIDQKPVVITVEQATRSEVGLKCFQRAQRDKAYGFFVGWTKDGKLGDPVEIVKLRP
ncbi:MAG: hypothetical protein HZB59_05865 [Ignavibacteriales bacterium]|nr:hypothetical protein [Ignavibacteriales bacterium]